MHHIAKISVATVLLMSTVPVAIKYTQAVPATIGLFRLSVAAFFILFFFRARRALSGLSGNDWRWLLILGLVFGGHWITYFYSIKISSASIGIIGTSTYGIHLLYLGWIYKKKRPQTLEVLAMILAFGGAVLIVPEFQWQNEIFTGMALGVVSGFLFALLPIIHQHQAHMPHHVRSLGQYLFGLLVFIPLIPQSRWDLPAVDWLVLLYLAIAGTVIAHTLWVRITTQVSTTMASILFYSVIPVTMVLSYFLQSEPMPLSKLTGAALIIGGNLIAAYALSKRKSWLGQQDQ